MRSAATATMFVELMAPAGGGKAADQAHAALVALRDSLDDAPNDAAVRAALVSPAVADCLSQVADPLLTPF
eukprot:9354475-Pyramimonas_sp.AAC.1